MKKITLISIIILIANTVLAQWIQQNPNYPENRNMLDIFFSNENHGVAVGEDLDFSGSYGTTDGGISWENCFIFGTFNSVFFSDQNNGWAVGNDGVIWHTNNGGVGVTGLWEEQQINSNLHLVSVFFTDSLNGWIGASTLSCNTIYEIHHTTDGGQNWELQHSSAGNLLDIFFIDSLNGWAVGGLNILKTTNGGENWSIQNTGHDFETLSAVYFSDQMNGWIVGEGDPPNGVILKTSNGGETWKLQEKTQIPFINDIAFVDSLYGWAVGSEGAIIHSDDGGDTWNFQQSGTSIDLYSISFVDEENAWVCGRKSIILHTDNGGFVGTNEINSSDLKFNIFPNPTHNAININFSLGIVKEISINIYNIYGQKTRIFEKGKREKGNHVIKYNLRDLPEGTYFVKIEIGTETFAKKIFKL